MKRMHSQRTLSLDVPMNAKNFLLGKSFYLRVQLFESRALSILFRFEYADFRYTSALRLLEERENAAQNERDDN